jgi:hypothetical protein
VEGFTVALLIADTGALNASQTALLQQLARSRGAGNLFRAFTRIGKPPGVLSGASFSAICSKARPEGASQQRYRFPDKGAQSSYGSTMGRTHGYAA